MNGRSAFSQALAERAGAVDAFLDQVLTPASDGQSLAPPERLIAAMRHGVLNGGKRLRPFLLLESTALLGGDDAPAMAVAAALECVHCYSLIHDDLPAMDDDDLRRGQPTVHRAFDEATAILAGDALLTLAFELIGRQADGLTAEQAAQLTLYLARAAGFGGMAGGQMLDLAHEHQTASPEIVETIHAMKTGALIRFACEAGAIVAPSPEIDRMSRFGTILGLAFQLADDLLDVTADSAAMGKATGKDASAGKQTLVQMHGIDWTRARLEALVGEAEALLDPYGDKAEVLRQAARFVAYRDH